VAESHISNTELAHYPLPDKSCANAGLGYNAHHKAKGRSALAVSG